MALAPSDRIACDILIIGTGAGGASVAATLAAAGREVLMLDEGPHIPASEAPAGLGASMLSMWRGGGLMSTLGSQIVFAEGRCVGGGTEINSAIFQEAPEAVLSEWCAMTGMEDFSAAALAPYYARARAAVRASLTPGELGPPTDILARAGHAVGWKVTPLERAQENCVGTNLCSAACPTGAKQSMTATLIPKALAKGARLLAQTQVRRLLRKGRRIVGAVADATRPDGRRQRIHISLQAVFVCAGTMQTPLLLARSGLARNAGRNFQLHPTIRVLARFKQPLNAHRHRLPLVAITEFMPSLRLGGSIFSLPSFGMTLAEDWSRRVSFLPDYAHYGIYYAMIRPDGVGRIHAVPFARDPIATYALTERDWRRLAEGARLLAKALFAAGAETITPSISGHPGWHSASEAESDNLVQIRQRGALMTVHLFGSCPMGANKDVFPVNPDGCLVGMENLYLADGGILPGAPGVNPQATIMALAFRNAEAFLALGARGTP